MKILPYYLLFSIFILVSSCGHDQYEGITDDETEPVNQEDLDEEGLPVRTFNAQLPEISTISEYIIDLDFWDIPNTNSDVVKTTENLQAAIDWAHNEGYTRVILPSGDYLVGEDINDIYYGGIEIYGNTEFVFSENAVLSINANNKWNYCVLRLNGDNITVRDGEIKGERDTHIFTTRDDGNTAHDEGHGICIWDNNNILIENMEIYDVTGDGSLVLDSNDVTFINNNIYNNRRQGISIVGGVRIEITNNEIHHINGTSPQFGIDIEGPGRVDEDILIENNYG